MDRGSLTVWRSPDALRPWTPRKNGRRGGQKRYSDRAIALALQLRLVFSLPWRQTEGLLRSLFVLLDPELDVPDHTTLSRRSRSLRIKPTAMPSSKPIHLINDAAGLRVLGQGERPHANHGSQGAQAGWRKLHLGIDAKGVIVTADLTDSTVADATIFPALVRKVKSPIKKETMDGSYDRSYVWKVIDDLPFRGVTPLHRRARPRDEP